MNEKIKQAVEKIRELDLYDLHSEDFDNILGALNNMEELIKGKDEYIAKLCNDRAELKEQLKQVEDFKNHYDRYKKELANNLKVINCMQEEETTNRNLIDSLEDRNDRLVERLEKQKAELNDLREFVKIIGQDFYTEYRGQVLIINGNSFPVKNKEQIDFLMKVVKKYGKR